MADHGSEHLLCDISTPEKCEIVAGIAPHTALHARQDGSVRHRGVFSRCAPKQNPQVTDGSVPLNKRDPCKRTPPRERLPAVQSPNLYALRLCGLDERPAFFFFFWRGTKWLHCLQVTHDKTSRWRVLFRARVRNLSVVVAGKQAKRVSGLQARKVRHQRDATRKGGKAANNQISRQAIGSVSQDARTTTGKAYDGRVHVAGRKTTTGKTDEENTQTKA